MIEKLKEINRQGYLKDLFLLMWMTIIAINLTGQKVGVNNTDPVFELDVTGTIRADDLIIRGNGLIGPFDNAPSIRSDFGVDGSPNLKIVTDYDLPGFQNSSLRFFEKNDYYGKIGISETYLSRSLTIGAFHILSLRGTGVQLPDAQQTTMRIGSGYASGRDGIEVYGSQLPQGPLRGLFDVKGLMVADTLQSDLAVMPKISDVDGDTQIHFSEGDFDTLNIALDNEEVMSIRGTSNENFIDIENSTVNLNFNSSSGSPHLRFNETGNDYTRLYFENVNSDLIAIAARPGVTSDLSRMNFFMNGSDVLTITGNKRLGINKFTPEASLHVQGDVSENDLLIVEHNNVEHLKVNTSGVVSIDGILSINNNYTLPTDYQNFSVLRTSNAGHTYWDSDYWDVNSVDIHPTDIDLNMGLGTSMPEYKLDVEDDKSSGYVSRIYNSGSSSNNRDGLAIRINTNGTPENNNHYISFQIGNGSNVGAIRGNGAGSIQLAQLSDRRHKFNINKYNSGLDLLANIETYSYEMNTAPGKKQIGFIAQEMYKVFPQMVSGDPETSTFDDPMMLNYSAITPILVSAVKELDAKNKSYEEKIIEQEERLESLETQLEILIEAVKKK